MLSAGVRRLEVFLDLVSLLTDVEVGAASHVFDPRFEALLSNSDRHFRDTMLHTVRVLRTGPDISASAGARTILRALEKMGLQEVKSDVTPTTFVSLSRSKTNLT